MSDITAVRKSVQKVYRGYHKRRGYAYIPHPIVRIGGSYLSQFDFEIGDTIEVLIEKGRIVISKKSGNEDDKA